jgi:hypothetical protein
VTYPAATLEPNGTGYDDREGPLSPVTYLPSLEDQATIKELTEKWEEAEQARRPQEENWLECVAFEANKQWHRYNWSTGMLELPNAPPWRIRLADNLIKPKVEQSVAALVQDIPLLEVEPMSGQERDKDKARVGGDLLKYLHERLRWERLLASLAKWSVICGSSFAKTFWDPFAQDTQAIPVLDPFTGQQALQLGPNGQPVPVWQGMRRHVGQVATQFCSPFEVYPEPGAQSFTDANWCFHGKVRTLKYIREAYPELGHFVSAGSEGSPGTIERRVSDIMDGGSGSGSATRQDKTAVVLEYWEKPCPQYPKGRCLTLCNGVLLKQRELPYPHLIERRSLPFIQFPYDPSDLSPWPRGLVEYLVPLQKAYNRALSDILGMLKMTGMPKILWPLECGARPSEPTSMPGQIIPFLFSNNAKPEYWAPPPIPQAWFELLQVLKADFEDVSNRHMVSSGSAPPGVVAGVSIQLLQGADDQAFGPKRALFHEAMAELGLASLSLAAAFYDEARLGWSIGEESDQRYLTAFSAQDLPSIADVRAVATSKTPMSRAAKQQQLFDLYDRGVFGPPGSPPANVTLLKRLEFGDVDKLAEEQQAYLQQQQQQQMMMELAKVGAQGETQMQLQGQKGEQQRQLAEETDTRLEEREAANSERSLEMDLIRQQMLPAPAAPKAGGRR